MPTPVLVDFYTYNLGPPQNTEKKACYLHFIDE